MELNLELDLKLTTASPVGGWLVGGLKQNANKLKLKLYLKLELSLAINNYLDQYDDLSQYSIAGKEYLCNELFSGNILHVSIIIQVLNNRFKTCYAVFRMGKNKYCGSISIADAKLDFAS